MNLMVGNTTMNGLKHHLRVEPYDYQREGIVYGLEHRRLIIGDEPGLGKTLQSIGIVDTPSQCISLSCYLPILAQNQLATRVREIHG